MMIQTPVTMTSYWIYAHKEKNKKRAWVPQMQVSCISMYLPEQYYDNLLIYYIINHFKKNIYKGWHRQETNYDES